jgi:hypothetical protein
MAFASNLSRVTVTRNPVKITRQEFDPAKPAANLPPLTPDEAGVTHFEFTCDAGIGVFVSGIDATTVEVRVDAVDLVLDLPIDIWVRKGARKKVYAHEEGHRQICEDYYANCGTIAKEIGEHMLGRRAIGHGRNRHEAETNAQQKLLAEIHQAYMTASRLPCRIAQDHFDDLTTHSLTDMGEAEAVAQAKAMQVAGKIPSAGLPSSSLVVSFDKPDGTKKL